MMVMDPYPGYEGEHFSMPCRNVLPKPLQKPHPPMWMACTNRATIEVAARNGLGALAFSFVNPDDAKHWADAYYSIIESDECRPIGHMVNANIAMVAPFSLHQPIPTRRSSAASTGSASSTTRCGRWSKSRTCPVAPPCGRIIWPRRPSGG